MVQILFHPQSSTFFQRGLHLLLGISQYLKAQCNRKAQRVRGDPSSYYIPVPIGPALPRRDRVELFPKYCRLMLVLFEPQRMVEDL